MDRLRRTLALLLDESVVIRDRIDAVLEPGGAYKLAGLGKAVVTPILLVAHPDRYGVWNEPAENGMKQLGLWPESRGLSAGERYERINTLLLRLRGDLGIDLWTLDALWWRISSSTVSAAISEEDFEAAIETLEGLTLSGPLDIIREQAMRAEQGVIRQALFSANEREKCTICGRDFPVDLLRAAHIKRRADCTTEEKKDYRNNVVPICTCGCDELFERGYLVVRNGRVAKGNKPATTEAVADHIGRVNDRPCIAYYQGSRQAYFDWHVHSHV